MQRAKVITAITVKSFSLPSTHLKCTHTHTDEMNSHPLIITFLLCLKRPNEVEVTYQQWARVVGKVSHMTNAAL